MPLLHLPEQHQRLYQQTLKALMVEDLPTAAKGAAKIIEQCADFDGGWLLLSQVAQKEGNISLAIRTATQAISRNPTNCLHYVQLGRCLAAMGKIDDAMKTAMKAEELGPESAGGTGCSGYAIYELWRL